MAENGPLFAEPMRMVLCSTKCQYCDDVDAKECRVEYLQSIQACKKHKPWAERDVKAWFYKHNKVRFQDVVDEPLFTLTTLLDGPITVVRTDGRHQNDWKLSRPSLENPCSPLIFENDVWYMRAESDVHRLQRGVDIRLFKLVLPNDQHGLVDDFLVKLNSGFYKSEYADHNAVCEENPVISSEPEPMLALYMINHPTFGLGRVFIPDSQSRLGQSGPTDPDV